MPRPGVFRAGATVYPSKIHVKLPAEDFFVVLLFLFQHGDFVDLSRYDAAGWTVRSSSFLENQKYKNSCKNA